MKNKLKLNFMFSLGLSLGLYSYQTRICQEGQRVLLQFKFA